MEEGKMPESHLTSAAAFVEGGIQEACDDACSICLEDFCDSDPSTLTGCKHEFHLQCILEWCQRSSQCPMCWQPISLKDPSSQELLDAVEHERNLRMNPPRNTTIFHHPTLGDFELQHLPVSASESELEERIIQHLAAAAAMGRARHFARREGHRNRSSAHGRPQFLVFSTSPTGASATSATSSIAQREGSDMPPAVPTTGSNSPLVTMGEDSAAQPSSAQANQLMSTATRASVGGHPHATSFNRTSPAQTSPSGQDRAGPSDFQSFSESLKSRLSAFSTKYKESITRSTRGWKERLFARNNSSATPEPSSEPIHGEGAQGVATVSRMMDHLDIAQDAQTGMSTRSNDSEDVTSPDQPHRHTTVSPTSPSNEGSPRAPPSAAATASVSN